jgi:hypothetical protein
MREVLRTPMNRKVAEQRRRAVRIPARGCGVLRHSKNGMPEPKPLLAPHQLPLVRDSATGMVHRRDCRELVGTSEEFTGLEHVDPAQYCNCVGSFACRAKARFWAAYACSSPENERDRTALVAWLTDLADGFEASFRRGGTIREQRPDLAVIEGLARR